MQLLKHIGPVDTKSVMNPQISGDPPRLHTGPAWREALLVDATLERLAKEQTLLLFEVGG